MPVQNAEFYDTHWSRHSPDSEVRYWPLWDAIRDIVGKVDSLVDMGCGCGGLCATWPEATRPQHVRLVDFSAVGVERAIARCGSLYGACTGAVADIRELDPMDYDAVVFSEVLEHLTAADAVSVWENCAGENRLVVGSVPAGEMKSKGHAQTYHDEDLVRKLYRPDGIKTVGCFLIFWRRNG